MVVCRPHLAHEGLAWPPDSCLVTTASIAPAAEVGMGSPIGWWQLHEGSCSVGGVGRE